MQPFYREGGATFSTADFVRQQLGIPTKEVPPSHQKSANKPGYKKARGIIVKVQVPFAMLPDRSGLGPAARSTGDLMVYTEKRDFICTIRRIDTPTEYDLISKVVREKGIGGAKAYFPAELRSKSELVVKTSDVLAAQPW